MKCINKITLLGYVGREPEIRHTSGGDTVANFSLATSEEWTDKHSGEKQKQTEWHNIVAWRGLGDVVAHYVAKGAPLYVEGKKTTRKWEARDGSERQTTEIVAKEIVLLGSDKQGGGHSNQSARSAPQQQRQPASTADDDFDDDIPF